MIEHLAQMFVSANTVVLISRLDDQRIVDVSPAFERIVGISRAEAIGRTTLELGLWPDARARQTIIDQLLQHGASLREPVAVQSRDGSFFDGLASCEIIVDQGQRYVFALLQDIRRHHDQDNAQARELESFRSLFAEADIGIYRRRPEGRGYLDVNPAMAAMLGYASTEALMGADGLDPAEIYVDAVHGLAVVHALKQNGRIARVHSQLRRADGGSIWVSENARAVHGVGGELLFYEGTLTDITPAVAAQQALEQSERLYRSLVENCRDGVFLMLKGTIVFSNEALARALDFTPAELIGTSYFDRISAEDRIEQQSRRQAREHGSEDVQSFEIHLLRKDGSRRLFEVRAAAVDYHGALASIGTMRDVTESRAQQQQLSDAEERYRLALWGSGDDWFDWDLSCGTLLLFRPSLVAKAPMTMQVASADAAATFVHPEDAAEYRTALLDHIANRSSHFEMSYRLRDRDGAWCWKLGRGVAVARDGNGVALRLCGTQRDISRIKAAETGLLHLTRELEARVQARTGELQDERRSLQERNIQLTRALDDLRRAQSELTESEKMASLGRLVAGVAHEVNTPLGVGLTAISFLRVQLNEVKLGLSKHFPAERVEALIAPLENAGAMTESNLLRAAELVRSFKQVAVDQSTRSIRTFGVRDYLQEIMRSLHPALKRAQHQFVLDCDGALQATSRSDAIYQIVVNLVMNSILHAYAPGVTGVLRISVVPVGDLLRLRYEDDGQGMAPAVAERVFEPFFTTRRESGGTGLGMHIVYNLVTQALAGRISLTTAPGKGVCFDVLFPRVHPGAPAVDAGSMHIRSAPS